MSSYANEAKRQYKLHGDAAFYEEDERWRNRFRVVGVAVALTILWYALSTDFQQSPFEWLGDSLFAGWPLSKLFVISVATFVVAMFM